MAALDTNVLVRLLVEDDAAQLAAARTLLRRCIAAQEVLFVPITVVLELEWVLRASYGFDKDDVLKAITALLSAAELSVESERALEAALFIYREGRADFADALHLALAAAAGETPLWTFDKTAGQLLGAQRL